MTAPPPSVGPYTTLRKGEGGVVTIALHPNRGTSLPLSLVLLRELEVKLQEVEEEAARGDASLLLIQTAPPHPTLTGYDLEEIRAFTSPGIFDWSQEAQSILRRLEQLTIPTVAVVRGDWAGGAAELALACSHRVAASSEARIALPQTRRGLVPAWGGTVRLPRLIGLHRALRLVLAGEAVSAREAHEIGLVDQLIPVAEFDERLSKFALGLAAATPSGARRSTRRKRKVGRRLFEDTAPGRRLLAARASRQYLRDTSATLAARLALELMVESSALSLTEAFDRESRVAGELIVTDETRGRLHSERVTEQAADYLPPAAEEPTSSAVIGAGETGSDLAYLLLRGGGPVRLKDARDAVRTGVARARGRIAWDVRQGYMEEEEGKRRSTMVEGVSGYGGFGLLDVAILAADGTAHVVREMATGLEPHIREECIVAFHDWSLSPTALQNSLLRPERVVGISPTFPVDRFPLLEILSGTRTSTETIGEMRRIARECGLTPIIVREPTPTPGVRLLGVYLAEATRLLENGASIEAVDAAMEAFGFPVGPFRRIDAIGTARVRRMLGQLGGVLGDRFAPAELLAGLAAGDATFYRYRGGRPAGPSSRLPEPGEDRGEELSQRIRRRILLLLINEAVRILEDACVENATDLDLISILALGFPREHGGLLYYAQSTGLPAIVNDLTAEAREGESCFAPASLLERLASEGRGFFANPRARSGHDSDAVLK